MRFEFRNGLLCIELDRGEDGFVVNHQRNGGMTVRALSVVSDDEDDEDSDEDDIADRTIGRASSRLRRSHSEQGRRTISPKQLLTLEEYVDQMSGDDDDDDLSSWSKAEHTKLINLLGTAQGYASIQYTKGLTSCHICHDEPRLDSGEMYQTPGLSWPKSLLHFVKVHKQYAPEWFLSALEDYVDSVRPKKKRPKKKVETPAAPKKATKAKSKTPVKKKAARRPRSVE